MRLPGARVGREKRLASRRFGDEPLHDPIRLAEQLATAEDEETPSQLYARVRQEMIDGGYGVGVPPEELDQLAASLLGGHAGTTEFTDEIIRTVNDKSDTVVFVLWGAYARKKKALIDTVPQGSARATLKALRITSGSTAETMVRSSAPMKTGRQTTARISHGY